MADGRPANDGAGTSDGAERDPGASGGEGGATEQSNRRPLAEWDRETFQTALDAVVREHRFTIAVVFPLVGAVTLLASAELAVPAALEPLRYNPGLLLFGTFVMRLPLIAGVLPLVDRRAGVVLGLLAAYAYGIELLGVTTGWPYGSFEYAIDLGPMLFGAVPIGLPIFFFPLVLNSYLLVLLLFGGWTASRPLRLAAVLATVLATDLVLDPGAVAIGFWTYLPPGPYYGVPWQNFAGWVLSGLVAVLAFDVAFARAALLDRLETCEFALDDLVSFVLLWGTINAVYGHWVPVGVAALFGAGLLGTDRFDFAVGDSRVLRQLRGWRRDRKDDRA